MFPYTSPSPTLTPACTICTKQALTCKNMPTESSCLQALISCMPWAHPVSSKISQSQDPMDGAIPRSSHARSSLGVSQLMVAITWGICPLGTSATSRNAILLTRTQPSMAWVTCGDRHPYNRVKVNCLGYHPSKMFPITPFHRVGAQARNKFLFPRHHIG